MLLFHFFSFSTSTENALIIRLKVKSKILLFFLLFRVMTRHEMSLRTAEQRPFKILLVGDCHVGKSSLLLRFVRNSFNPNMRATIGVDFLVKNINIDGTDYVFQLWDTGEASQ